MEDRPPDGRPGRGTDGYPGTPRWVKGFGIVAVLAILLVAFILITGLAGLHGPQRHGAGHEGVVRQVGIGGPVAMP